MMVVYSMTLVTGSSAILAFQSTGFIFIKLPIFLNSYFKFQQTKTQIKGNQQMETTLMTRAMQTLTIIGQLWNSVPTNYKLLKLLEIPKVNEHLMEKLMTTGTRFNKDQMVKMYSPIQEPPMMGHHTGWPNPNSLFKTSQTKKLLND
jgi:hypothetical protein